MPVRNSFAGMAAEITVWRRDLHVHPEIGYEVHRTAGIVAEKPRGFGCDAVTEGVGRTGVVGVIRDTPLILAGEDFSYMLERRPGAHIFLGNGDTAQVHHPEYDFNDDAIPAGCSWFAELVERRMKTA